MGSTRMVFIKKISDISCTLLDWQTGNIEGLQDISTSAVECLSLEFIEIAELDKDRSR